MELRIKATICSGFAILALSGKLRVLDSSLHRTLNALLARGCHEFVLDLSELEYIDCSGLSQLIRILNAIRDRGGVLALSRPQPHILRILQITKLDSVFMIQENRCRTNISREATQEAIWNLPGCPQ